MWARETQEKGSEVLPAQKVDAEEAGAESKDVKGLPSLSPKAKKKATAS